MLVCFVFARACVTAVCFVCISLCGVVCGLLCVRCVCVRVSTWLCVVFVACCALLYGLHLMLAVLCSCVLLDMCRLWVRCIVWCCMCGVDGLCGCVFV